MAEKRPLAEKMKQKTKKESEDDSVCWVAVLDETELDAQVVA